LEPRLNGEEGLLKRLLPVVEHLEALEDAKEVVSELLVGHHVGGAMDAGRQSSGWRYQSGRRCQEERLRHHRQGRFGRRRVGGVDGSGRRIAGHR
jgi:hypothetical protein